MTDRAGNTLCADCRCKLVIEPTRDPVCIYCRAMWSSVLASPVVWRPEYLDHNQADHPEGAA